MQCLSSARQSQKLCRRKTPDEVQRIVRASGARLALRDASADVLLDGGRGVVLRGDGRSARGLAAAELGGLAEARAREVAAHMRLHPRRAPVRLRTDRAQAKFFKSPSSLQRNCACTPRLARHACLPAMSCCTPRPHRVRDKEVGGACNQLQARLSIWHPCKKLPVRH